MRGSSNRVDFSLRPAKHAERRMMTEIFRRLRPFQPVEDYLYIGLGSLWFTDFALFHRTLGVKRLISMEREVSYERRFDDNKPFAAVTMDYRDSSLVLPDVDWSHPNFVWLDYDDPLQKSMLYDAQSIATRCASGTVLATTIQSYSAKQVDEAEWDKTSQGSALLRFRGQWVQMRYLRMRRRKTSTAPHLAD